jgi:hypothetical protein
MLHSLQIFWAAHIGTHLKARVAWTNTTEGEILSGQDWFSHIKVEALTAADLE